MRKRTIITAKTNALFLCCVFTALISFASYSTQAAEPNETFATATILNGGVLTTGLQSFDDGGNGIIFADTTLAFFTDNTFTTFAGGAGNPDDNTGVLGDALSSGLYELNVLPDGSVPLAVGGFIDQDNNNIFDDQNFDGLSDVDGTPHNQSGELQLILLIWEIGNPTVTVDSRVEEISLAPGNAESFFLQDNSWIGHQFTALVDNTIDGGNDVDFWRFEDLAPGATFSAEISSSTPQQDTFMGWFNDANGTLIQEDDDAGDEFLSKIEGTVPTSGDLVFGVTSFDDFDFIGAHGGSGDYTLTITLSNVAVPGDFDADGDVDADDFSAWQNNYATATGATLADGDADTDGDVDGDDFLTWQANYAPSTSASSQSTVPEPTAFFLALIAIGIGFAKPRMHNLRHISFT